jgi:hypothetical protein
MHCKGRTGGFCLPAYILQPVVTLHTASGVIAVNGIKGPSTTSFTAHVILGDSIICSNNLGSHLGDV